MKDSDSPLPWGIIRLGNMIGRADVQAGLSDGRWVRAVPEPYRPNLVEALRAAWWVLRGRAFAVVWPEHGELEEG